MELREERVTRYLQPLREGGSLPALVEADDDFKYVLKFRGAGHGTKALISELIGGEVARAVGLRVPELVFLTVGEEFGRTEGDEEIQDLLNASRGRNLGLHFLSGAMTIDPYANPVDERLASKIVWLDSFLTNVDRTVQNTNMLLWNKDLWLIDHGASLYFHHSWSDHHKAALSPFPYVKSHALLRKATLLEETDKEMHGLLTVEKLAEIVELLPDDWFWEGITPEEGRRVYREFLTERLNNSKIFVDHAERVRKESF